MYPYADMYGLLGIESVCGRGVSHLKMPSFAIVSEIEQAERELIAALISKGCCGDCVQLVLSFMGTRKRRGRAIGLTPVKPYVKRQFVLENVSEEEIELWVHDWDDWDNKK